MQNASNVESLVDRAMADSGPVVPAPPQIKTRPSLPHLLVGNLTYLLLIAAGMRDFVSWWIVVPCALGAAIVALHTGPTEALKQEFRNARLKEVRPLFDSDQAAAEQVENDIRVAIDTEPMVPWVAIPMFLLSLAALMDVFASANESLATWIWPLRWALAALAALTAWFAVGSLWASSNLTPAFQRIDYMELKAEEEEATRFGDHDRNDFHIIRQTVNLESLHRRIDTYTLESALLSALSFSSFMAIVLSEHDYAKALPRLFTTSMPWHDLDEPVPLLDVTGLPVITPEYIHSQLIPLIALMLLLCASTFLGVLVGRLRFNDGYRDAESLLKVADRINEKEEKSLEDGNAEKAGLYTSAIETLLRNADDLERGLGATVAYMRISRNLGVVFFILALVLCGFFFSDITAGMIALLFLTAWVIGYFDRLARSVVRREVFSRGVVGTLLRPFRRGGA